MIDWNKPLLYFIMGSNNTKVDPAFVLEEAIKGGIDLFQFREKGLLARKNQEKYELGKQLRDICRNYRIPFIVNDDVELAIALGADAIHIGQEDEPIGEVRKKLPASCLIGLSTSTINDIKHAETAGADYLGIGPVFSTNTKTDAKKPIGIEKLAIARRETNLPLIAIGGITIETIPAIIQSGVNGVAVISAISTNPEHKIREITAQLKSSLFE